MCRRLIIFILLLSVSINSWTQSIKEGIIEKEHLIDVSIWSQKDGLPTWLITDMCQDKAGNIWMGTAKGFCRFDGHFFEEYNFPQNPNQGNVPFFIAPDNSGNIWTLGSIIDSLWSITDPIDRKQYTFEAYTGAPFPFQGQKFSTYRTPRGIYFFNNREGWRYNGKLERVLHLSKPRGTLLPAPNEHFWAIDQSSSIRLLDEAGEEQAFFPLPFAIDPASYSLDEDQNLWLSGPERTPQQLYRVSPKGLQKVYLNQVDSWGNQIKRFNPVACIPGNGYAIFLDHDRKYRLFYKNQVIITDLKQWLRDHFQMDINQDQIFSLGDPGVIWISGIGGLIRLKFSPLFLKWYLNQEDEAISIRDIVNVRPNQLGICTYKGFFLQELGGKSVRTSIPEKPAPKAVLPEANCLWIGTFSKVVYQYFPKQDSYRQLQNLDTVSMREANCLFHLSSSERVIGSDNGLWRIDSLRGTFKRFAMLDTAVYYAYHNKNQIWLGTEYGLYDWNNRTLHPFITPGGQGDHPVAIYHFCVGPKETFWMATNRGLLRWNASESGFRFFSHQEGLPTGRYHSVYRDRKGTLWISANEGLAKFDPQTGQSLPLKSMHSIQHQEFNYLAHHQDSIGRLYYGGLNGLLSFHPDSLPVWQQKEVNPIQLNKVSQRSWLYPNDIRETAYRKNPERIKIAANIRQISLDFRFPYFDQTPPIFQWRMAGYVDEWQRFTDGQLVLQRLPYGKQSLEIRVYPKDAPNQSLTCLDLELLVAYPIYLRWWFLLLLSLALVGLVRGIILWRGKQLRMKNIELQQMVDEKTQTIQSQAHKLETMLKIKNQLFTDISHEFRTPLSLIIGHTELLTKELSQNQDHLISLGKIQHNSQYIREMVEDFLNLARLESQELQLQPGITEWPHFFTQIFQTFQARAQEKGIDLQLNVYPPQKEIIFLDHKMVKRVINNLVSNAFKFTPDHGTVKLEIQKKEGMVDVLVTDSGPGIAAEDMPYIFDRYFKGTRTEDEGFGIGLALCKSYAELMQGTVTIEHTSPAGSAFLFRFPLSSAPADFQQSRAQPIPEEREVAASSPILRPQNQAQPHLLIVEDNTEMQNLLQLILHKEYRLTMANNGYQALTKLNSNADIALIVSDIMMPKMDGFELLKTVRETPHLQHLPFLLLTAKAENTAKKKAFHLGSDFFLSKPFEAEELRSRVASMIHNIQLRKAHWQSLQPKEVMLDHQPKADRPESYDHLWLKELEEVIKPRLDDPKLKIGDLAVAMHVSERTLRNRVKSYTGLSPAQYMKKIRLHRALFYLENRQYPTISEVCFAVGMRNVSHFAQVFKKEFGCLPSKYLSD